MTAVGLVEALALDFGTRSFARSGLNTARPVVELGRFLVQLDCTPVGGKCAPERCSG